VPVLAAALLAERARELVPGQVPQVLAPPAQVLQQALPQPRALQARSQASVSQRPSLPV
jgi:hypothetical protein